MINFKTPRIRDEFAQLPTKNPAMFDLLDRLNSWVANTYKKDITITCIYRTPEENDALYNGLLERPKGSPHVYWKAVDLRSRGFTQVELSAICAWLNAHFKNALKPVAFVHALPNNAAHFHIQYRLD